MAENSKIEWTHHTGGPWLGCTEVSPGCAHCYARELALTRLEPIFRKAYKAAQFEDWKARPIWGDKAPRVLSKGFWTDAPRLNNAAAKAGERYRMFPSMIDWLDDMPAGIIDQDGNWLEPVEVLVRFLKLIHDTPNLDWLLLTKRPENWRDRVMGALASITDGTGKDGEFWQMLCDWVGGKAPSNVWIGTTVEDQPRTKRIADVLKIPAKVRFLSVEPMLGPLEFSDVTRRSDAVLQLGKKALDGIHWAIFGGESGAGARACNIEWIRDGVRQCRAAGVAPFVKQLGAKPLVNEYSGNWAIKPQNKRAFTKPITLKDKKGGDWSEWPEDLRVREFPKVA